MGKFSAQISDVHEAFIGKQKMFFVATTPSSPQGHLNLSPKGLDAFRVISPTEVIYMDIIGSGNETAAHLQDDGRITFMFCAFEGSPNILRLYGHGQVIRREHPEWETYQALFTVYPSTRQFIYARIHLVQTSCGYGVPFYAYQGERSQHFDWAAHKGTEGLARYEAEKNRISLDGQAIAPASDS